MILWRYDSFAGEGGTGLNYNTGCSSPQSLKSAEGKGTSEGLVLYGELGLRSFSYKVTETGQKQALHLGETSFATILPEVNYLSILSGIFI